MNVELEKLEQELEAELDEIMRRERMLPDYNDSPQKCIVTKSEEEYMVRLQRRKQLLGTDKYRALRKESEELTKEEKPPIFNDWGLVWIWLFLAWIGWELGWWDWFLKQVGERFL